MTLLSIIIILICAQLWRMGGNGNSVFRNPIIPVVLGFSKLMLGIGIWYDLGYIFALYVALQAFSYGLDTPIHDFWERVWHCGSNGDAPFVEMCTRGTCGFLWSLPAFIFARATGHWGVAVGYSIFLTIANGLIWLIKDVRINERLVGACVALAILV